jgi:hypothetical protein
VPFLFSQEAMRYLFASMLACFAAVTASIAASTDSLKRRAYHKPPYVRARRIRITSPDGDYRRSAREVKVVAINEHAAAAPRKVVMAVSTIVMRGGAPHSTQIHVSMVLDNLVARVASFPEEEDGIAEQFAQTLSAAVGLLAALSRRAERRSRPCARGGGGVDSDPFRGAEAAPHLALGGSRGDHAPGLRDRPGAGRSGVRAACALSGLGSAPTRSRYPDPDPENEPPRSEEAAEVGEEEEEGLGASTTPCPFSSPPLF